MNSVSFYIAIINIISLFGLQAYLITGGLKLLNYNIDPARVEEEKSELIFLFLN